MPEKMTTHAVIDSALLNAYMETEFRILLEPMIVLNVERHQPELVALHAHHGVSCSAFVTACNPYSQPYSAQVNAERQVMLARELSVLGLRFLPALGIHPSGQWPGEASFMVLGMDLGQAKALGQRLEQNAIVWTGVDGIPALVLL